MFDRIVTSTDDNQTYLDFWKIQILAHKKFFPSKKFTIAFVTERNYDDEIILDMKSNDIDVVIFRPIEEVPNGNLAKVARFLCASLYENEVCVITDMDTIPLQSDYLTNLSSLRIPENLLCVGAEVYFNTADHGKFPAHHTIGEGRIFKEMYNPHELSYVNLVDSLCKMKKIHRDTENIKNMFFSDESLNAALLENCKINKQHVPRKINTSIEWIDRSYWSIDEERLKNFKYVECNLLRPYYNHIENFEPILNFLKN